MPHQDIKIYIQNTATEIIRSQKEKQIIRKQTINRNLTSQIQQKKSEISLIISSKYGKKTITNLDIYVNYKSGYICNLRLGVK